MRAWVLLPLLACAWGATWPLMKIGTADIPIFTFRALTGVIAGVALLGLGGLRFGRLRPLKSEWRGILICAPISVTGWFYFSALGVTLLPASRAALLAYTMPLWAFIIGVMFLKEPVLKRRCLGVAAGVGAIVLLARDDMAQAVGSGLPWGIFAITAAAIVWSVGSTLQKEFNFQSPVTAIAGWQLLIGAVPLAVLALIFDGADWMAQVGWQPWAALLGVALISQATGMWTWFTILQMTSMAFASLSVLAVPLIGMGLSMLLLGEPIGWVEIAGFALITLGLGTVLPFDRLFSRRRGRG
jgi:drug/metabolite transporter (DMT)-like permease